MISLFSDDITTLLQIKKNQGVDVLRLENIYADFDSYCFHHHPKTKNLTQEIVNGWVFAENKSKSKHHLYMRILSMRNLGRHQLSIGKEAFVIRQKVKLPKPSAPHLLNDRQLSELFVNLDNMVPMKVLPNAEVILPVMLRLVYCCGLRISEAIKLKISDFDFENQTISILQSKGSKDRKLYLHSDLADLLLRFNDYIKLKAPHREYFFHSAKKNGPIPYRQILFAYNTALSKINTIDNTKNKPTLHGLRHLFAVNSLRKCIAEGKDDFNNWIKYLSKYMGHATSNETMHYLHLVSDLFPSYKSKLDMLTEGFGVSYVED